MKYNALFKFIPFLGTHLQIRPVDGFSRFMAETTRTRARMCLLGVSLILPPILGVKSPKPKFLRRAEAFSSQTSKIVKVSYYRNYCTDFNQILQTTETNKWSSWVVLIRAQQIQDSVILKITKNRDISEAV